MFFYFIFVCIFIKEAYNKTFSLDYREKRRQQAFEKNLAEISKHNEAYDQGLSTFRMGTTSLSDLEPQEYRARYIKLEASEIDLSHAGDMVQSFHVNQADVPSALDWREEGFVTPPENQKSCGSCYAFSIAGMFLLVYKLSKNVYSEFCLGIFLNTNLSQAEP